MAGLDQRGGRLGAALPVRPNRRAGLVAVQPQPDAFGEQALKVPQVGRVVAVADVDPVEVEALIFEDGDLLFADPVRSVAVGRDPDAGLLGGPDGGAQDDFSFRRDALGVVGDLDDASLDAGPLDALLDLTDEQRCDLVSC